MEFLGLLQLAKEGEQSACTALLDRYAPILYKSAVINGTLDEDLLQELRIVFLRCIQNFKVE